MRYSLRNQQNRVRSLPSKLRNSKSVLIKRIKPKRDDVNIGTGRYAKSVAIKSTIADMSTADAKSIYNSAKKSTHTLKENANIVLSVIMPYFRAGYIGWVPFESLIRQVGVNFDWELIVLEEDFENPFGLDRILEYKDRLADVGCCLIKYISISKWLPLSAKWFFLIDECADSTQVVAMNAADIYCSKHRLNYQYNNLTKSDKNWYKIGANVLYDISLNKHVKTIVHPTRSDSCCAAMKIELAKKLPLACVKRNVDSWRYNTLKPVGIKYFHDMSAITNDTVNINGLNNITVTRKERIIKLSPPLRNCCNSLESHLPKEVITKLIACKKYIKQHVTLGSVSSIKIR